MSSLLSSALSSTADFCRSIDLPLFLSAGSSLVTLYFWLVKMNRERAGLRLYRVGDFRPDRPQCADAPGKEKAIWYGEIYLANPSTLPAAVVRLRVQLRWRDQWLDGRLVHEKKDDLPWTVEPLRVLTRSFGCAFLVEEGISRDELCKPHKLRFTYTTVDGRTRSTIMETCAAASAMAA